MEDKIELTRSGYESLKKELKELKERLMNDVAKKIKEAREFGDLSENSEYDEAKNLQGKINSRISEIEGILSRATIISDDRSNIHEVNLGNVIRLKRLKRLKDSSSEHDKDSTSDQDIMEFLLVTAQEADIFKNKISVDSPLGKAIYKRKVGETVRVKAPSGTNKYKIVEVMANEE